MRKQYKFSYGRAYDNRIAEMRRDRHLYFERVKNIYASGTPFRKWGLKFDPADIFPELLSDGQPEEVAAEGEAREQPSKGQGFRIGQAEKKATERHAMDVATKHYETLGYLVRDTSANCPYDLEAYRPDRKIRVEVKGTTSELGEVMVTIGEVESARKGEVSTDLFIVHRIRLKELGFGEYVGEGGEIMVEEAWSPTAEELEPTQFRYRVRPVQDA